MLPARVFASPTPNGGYTLYRYLYGTISRMLGIPEGTEQIGTATNERDARKKLRAHLRGLAARQESLVEQVEQLIGCEE